LKWLSSLRQVVRRTITPYSAEEIPTSHLELIGHRRIRAHGQLIMPHYSKHTLVPINILTMTKLDHRDEQSFILYFANHSIIANPDSVELFTL
jgi:hypothetical protein